MNADEKVNILLVDDQPAKLLSYEVILSELNENLVKAQSAKEALQHLLQVNVAVVLIDVCMPEMDGFELAEMIRKHPRCDETSIIFVSAVYQSDFDRLRGYGCGAVDYVQVPVVPEVLRAKVGVFADLYRKTEQLRQLNNELERRVAERTAELVASTSSLRESEEKFRSTFECNMIPMGVWTNGVITEANDALLELVGCSRQDLAAGHVNWPEASSPNDAALNERFWDEISTKGVGLPSERLLRHKNGRHIHILFGGASFGNHKEQGVFFAMDLTERKQVEEDKARLLESERLARTLAERANRLKDEFLATLSHELRTPINAVLGWVQLLTRGKLDAASVEHGLGVIERGVRTQVQLIDELLDVNRITSGKFQINDEPVDLAAVFKAAVETILPQAKEKGIAVTSHGDLTGAVVRGDATRLQQVFWNLLANSTKFTPSGGRIETRTERIGDQVHLTVSDTGQGINPDFLPHIFERFRQADSSTTRRHGGLGLGLAIAKYIVELHRGSITAESNGEGLGSRFTVTLPLQHASNQTACAAPSCDENMGDADLAGVRVLIVDDDPATREIVSRTLQEYAAEVLTATCGDEALRALADWRPDLLVCDIGLPDKDGYALIGEIRRCPKSGGIPALALTAYTRPEDRTKAFKAGYNAYLPKPVIPQQLVRALTQLASRGTATLG
jgi:PAS domain S-box-containing protein